MGTLSTTYLDEALANFSGYLAIDEVYDGPFCILSVVDNRQYNRLACCVLEHDPTHEDVRTFLSNFKEQLDKRSRSGFRNSPSMRNCTRLVFRTNRRAR